MKLGTILEKNLRNSGILLRNLDSYRTHQYNGKNFKLSRIYGETQNKKHTENSSDQDLVVTGTNDALGNAGTSVLSHFDEKY
jgi:hypothetical protein